jgi:hypothetical protein
VSPLAPLARFTRQLAAAGVFFCALKFSAQAVTAAGTHFQPKPAPLQTREGTVPSVTPEQVSAHRPDLEKLKELMAEEASVKTLDSSAEPVPQAKVRQILVDVGPSRSEVFLNGVRSGKTPYAGQISCTEGATIVVEVLPPRGMPWRKEIRCGGIRIIAQQ